MRTTIDLDPQTARELRATVSLTREKPAEVLRAAVRAGLPVIANRFQAPRPAGYFADAYENLDPDRLAFERQMARATRQKLER